MSKRILLPIIIVLIIIGAIAIKVTDKIESRELRADEIVSMKFFLSKERNESYHSVPKHIESENINEIIEVLNNENLEINDEIKSASNSTRKLYMFLNNKNVIVINKSNLSDDEYIVKFQEDSILQSVPEDKYILIKSSKLKGVFERFEKAFDNPNSYNMKMRI